MIAPVAVSKTDPSAKSGLKAKTPPEAPVITAVPPSHVGVYENVESS